MRTQPRGVLGLSGWGGEASCRPAVVSGLVLFVNTSGTRCGQQEERDEVRGVVSRQGMQWYTPTHRSATRNPLSPQPPAPRPSSIAAQ